MLSGTDPTSPTTDIRPIRADRERVERVIAPIPSGSASHSRHSKARATDQELLKAVEQVNGVLNSFSVQFELASDQNRTIIRIIDRVTGELIRQIPPEEALSATSRLNELRGVVLRLSA